MNQMAMDSYSAPLSSINTQPRTVISITDGTPAGAAAVKAALYFAGLLDAARVHVVLYNQDRQLTPIELLTGLHLTLQDGAPGLVVEQERELHRRIGALRAQGHGEALMMAVATRWEEDAPGMYPGIVATQIFSGRLMVPLLMVPPGFDPEASPRGRTIRRINVVVESPSSSTPTRSLPCISLLNELVERSQATVQLIPLNPAQEVYGDLASHSGEESGRSDDSNSDELLEDLAHIDSELSPPSNETLVRRINRHEPDLILMELVTPPDLTMTRLLSIMLEKVTAPVIFMHKDHDVPEL